MAGEQKTISLAELFDRQRANQQAIEDLGDFNTWVGPEPAFWRGLISGRNDIQHQIRDKTQEAADGGIKPEA